jgi:signal transduction histidine kinase
MVKHLRQRQMELLKSKEEIEVLSKSLEKKVEVRTKELSESQLATMNILEDLTETNEKLKIFTGELVRAKKEVEMQSWGLQKANDGIKALYHELEKKNVDLAKLNRLKDDFVSIVAHELRNPLGVVREAAAVILDGLVGPVSEDQKKYIEIIKRTGDRLIHITTDLLDLAKIESGKIVVNYEKIDLLSLVRQSCEGITLRAHKKGITVSEDFPAEKLEIQGDFEKLSQVMINLLSNALKFTEKGGITVEVKDLGEEVRCAVKDTGPGISRENLSRLFSKFEQFGKPTTSSEKGSGLGLVISKSIIEAHDGRMEVESEPGKGSSFIFIIPKQHRQKKLGEILLEEKTLTPEQLAEALRKQKGRRS